MCCNWGIVVAESDRTVLVVVALDDLEGLTSLLFFLGCPVTNLVAGPALGCGRTGELSREGFGELVTDGGCEPNVFLAILDVEGCFVSLECAELDDEVDSFIEVDELRSLGSSTSGTPAMEWNASFVFSIV